LIEIKIWFNQHIVRRNVGFLNLVDNFLCLVKAMFLFCLLRKCIGYYVDLMALLSWLFISLYGSYNHCFMAYVIHGCFNVFTHN